MNNNTIINTDNDVSPKVSESKTLFKSNCHFNSSFQTNSHTYSIKENEVIVNSDNSSMVSNNCFTNSYHLGNTYGNQVSYCTDDLYSIKNYENFYLNNYNQNFEKLENEKHFLNKENCFYKNELDPDDMNCEFDQLDLTFLSNNVFDFSTENNNDFESNFGIKNDLTQFLS